MGLMGVAGRKGEVRRSDVVRVGRRQFLRHERIDVVAIAAELGVSRATVYRWFGDRERVVGHVLLSLASDTLDLALTRQRLAGAAGLSASLVAMLRDISGHPAFRAYLETDPQKAMIVLTGLDSVVAGGLRARLHALILDECPEAVGPELSAEEVAYSLVRLSEAYCYADVIAGRKVDVNRARPIFERILEAT